MSLPTLGENRFTRPAVSTSRPSANLAGRAVRLSLDVPVAFDGPLAQHHKTIGRWAAAREAAAQQYSRVDARRHIERTFQAAVLEILEPIKLADLRVVVLVGDSALPPALAVICDSVGALDLEWIEKSNVLSQALAGPIAPVGWQAAAYKALTEALPAVLPIFGFEHLFEELSAYYWEGETDDVGATRALIEWQGQDPNEIDEEMLPSAVKARCPAWMHADNAAPLKHLPKGLCARIRRLRAAHKAVKDAGSDGGAWHFDFHVICEYVSDYEDSSTLPPMTLVPFEQFARELDDVGRIGMETRFMDCAGLCMLSDVDRIDAWFASLRLGAELLLAAQDLIETDPATECAR
ncbi:hypothetical protein [Sphingomonas sp. MMS24-J13]|uniref:hypothetical protein n=1 Tax=Sphingomonas sp. MMS24-J13 TaxID=3238686 RepID=UPI00385022B5